MSPAGHRVSAPTFVGRGGELAALARALASPPAVAVVEGEAGIGKTRLVTELRAHPAVAGRRFVAGAFRRIREPFPLGAVIEGVRGLASELAAARLSPVAGALRPLLPELAARLPPLPEPLDDRTAERHRVFRGLTEVLGAAGPAVLVLEDLHWADQHTVDFLGYLLGDPHPRLSVLLTFRGEEVDPAVRAVTATAPAPLTRTHLELAPLDAAQTGALAAAILEVDRVSGEFATHLRDRASGLPFVIEELLALLRARGQLTRRRGGAWVRKAIDELDVPAGVRDPVRERFARLPDEAARAVAEAAAVLQTPVPVPVLVATSRLPEAAARHGVETALASGLLAQYSYGAVGFRHLLAAQAIYEAVPGPRRRQLHARAAAALAAQDPVPLGQRAHHLRHAGLQQEWVAAAEQAAGRAVALGHDDEAARLLEDVLREAPLDPDTQGRVALTLARAAHQLLHVDDDLVGLLSGALAHELPPPVRGELRLRVALLLERTGADFHTHRPLLAAAVPDLADQPALAAHAMAGLGIPVPGVPVAEHMQWLQQVLARLPAVDDPALRVSLLGKVAMVQVAVGDRQWRQLADRILADTGGAPRQPAEVSAFHSVGANACYAGQFRLAGRLLTAASASGKSRWRELSTRATLALLDYLQGRWDGLAHRAEVLTDQLAGHAPGRADVDVVTGCLALARGDLEPASPRLAELAHRLAERGAFDVLPLVAAAGIRLALGHGEHAAAVAQARWFVAAVESVPFLVSAAWALPDVTAALVAAGEHDRAQAIVAQWERHLHGLDAPLAAAALPHSRGTLNASAGQLRAAADQYEALGCSYEAARAREQAGTVLLMAGTTGAVELRTALTIFQRLGAAWDLDRASGTARRYGVSVPARHRGGRRGYGDDLSPREREVAELAADGRRNKEIADALYLSTSTVRKHLAAAMRKLGVTSRTVLAHRLPARRAP